MNKEFTMKKLLIGFVLLTSVSAYSKLDKYLNCDFYNDGEGRGTNTGSSMELKHKVEYGMGGLRTSDSPRNFRDNKLDNMNKNIVANFKDSQFRITELENYSLERTKLFLEVYKKDDLGNVLLISKLWLHAAIKNLSVVSSYYFPNHVQVQCSID
jgi:hypothetical protein